MSSPTGTVTLSDATVGTGRTITFSTTPFAGGGTGTSAWYVNGFIRHTGGGIAKITDVVSSSQVTVDVITAFTTTTPTAANVRIPGPHPDDYDGSASALTGAANQQVTQFINCAKLFAKRGQDFSAIIAAEAARTGTNENAIQANFVVNART